jgi:diguanylate cyclase (GGDEF)-like protein/PAS domain S-box-containing protein
VASNPRGLFLTGVIATLAVAPVFALGHRFGVVADVPLVVLMAALGASLAVGTSVKIVYPPGSRGRDVFLRALVMSIGVGAVMYLTGWGAALSVGLVFVAVEQVRLDGSRAAHSAGIAMALVIAVGEALIAADWIPSLMPQPEGHGIALLATVGCWVMIGVLGFGAREKERVEASLRHSEERLRALVQHAADAIVVMHLDGTVAYASPATERVLGYEPGTLERLHRELVHPEHRQYSRDFYVSIAERPGAVGWLEVPLQHSDGGHRWFEVGLSNRIDDPAVGGLVLNMRDVTERRAAQEQLTFQAHHDALTKLPNRWMFLERLEHALFAASTSLRYVCVLFLDIDRFKMVNDSLGHDHGDRVLVAVAERLRACVRPCDVVARFGGDEFTVLLPSIPSAEVATCVAERITERLREPIQVGDHELFISASVGVALSHAGDDRARELLRHSDLAMYVAKEKGRARWEQFDPSEVPHVADRLELEGDLWRAIETGELSLHFQPEVDLVTGALVAAEALVRWEHPRRGMLEPDAFIPWAEESQLIVAVDRYVLREACVWAKSWAGVNKTSGIRSRGGPLVVSVNLSPRFIRQTDVVTEVTNVLRETGVDPRCIQIELTERSALTDLESTCTQLHQLRALGVRVAVDDFGTGYSSLSYLKQLPIDVLKLDRSLLDAIDAVDVRPSDVAIVQAVVTMGHALGVKVTAEGVERVEQAQQLRALGCDSAMGWLWSKALPPEELWPRAAAGFDVGTGESGRVLQLRRA